MTGPFLPGTLRGSVERLEWEKLVRGSRYRVSKDFLDADGGIHREGEEWRFIGSYFVPYDSELSILVQLQDGMEWRIPLRWENGAQLAMCENIFEYLSPA